ncbi:multicopper oxidase family protein [Wenzhouxiangella sp. EGI_FJ10409]|uniref:multicopper oxidase family protein n=1 Tax=Wenzhouxiangella sp. EGI_FJ10409 TaxID=3243767 RepID=UPI0035E19AD0
MNRRNFLSMAVAAGLLALHPRAGLALAESRRPLPLKFPPQVDLQARGVFDLTAGFGSYDLGDGPLPGAMLINDLWPSPTLSITQGQDLDLTLFNDLDEPTIIHWHGLTPPADMDGHPTQVIDPGTSRPYQFTVDNRRATYWYHPHPHHRTAAQVYYGMTGFLLVDDGQDEARGLPTGSRDISLLLGDRRVSAGGELAAYDPNDQEKMVGFLGDTVLVNGQDAPAASVEPAVLKLRLLNGSSARILNPAFSDGRDFWLVATDAGLLDEPVQVNSVLLSPGERIEILVDLREDNGGSLDLVSAAFSLLGSHPPGVDGPPQGTAFDLMTLNVNQPLDGPSGSIPGSFEPMPEIDSTGAPVRPFDLTQDSMNHYINGLQYDIDRTDFYVPVDTVEIWRFTNNSAQPHPMHMHGAQFRVLSRTGDATPTDQGWKDTVLVRVGETVDIALQFDKLGLFLFHCHNLEHEDHGMMLNFEVQPADGIFADRFESG